MGKITVSICALLVFGSIAGASAMSVVDQQYTGASGHATAETTNCLERAQTFTVGLTGKMTRVEFGSFRRYSSTADLMFSIRNTDSNAMPLMDSTSNVFQRTLHASDLPSSGVLGINLGDGIAVQSGQTLSFVLSSTEDTWDYAFDGSYWRYPPTYQRGNLYYKPLTDQAWTDEGDYDLYFTTYVEPTPEPSSFMALMAGLGGLGGMILHKRK